MAENRKRFPSVLVLALEKVNKYSYEINSDANYKAPCYLNAPQGTRLPVIDEFTTFKFLSQQKRTAAGPDNLPLWFWEELVEELSPTVTSIFNLSIKSQTLPCSWKFANISPVPKETPCHP